LSFQFKERVIYLYCGIVIDSCLVWLFLRLQRRDKVKGWGEYRTDCNLDKTTFGKGKLGVNLNAIEKLETYKLNSIFI